MKKISLLLGCLFILLSCQNKAEEATCDKPEAANTSDKKTFEMYEMSEMALLMEQMYVDNQRLKERIVKGEAVGEFPSHFANIHNSIMTDPSENDEFFKKQSKIFLEAQELIYNDPENSKEHFNKAVQACISCHEVKCSGPIVRIKKLTIQ
jgi:cytochrome c553